MRNLEVLISAGAVLIAYLIIQAVRWLNDEGLQMIETWDVDFGVSYSIYSREAF
jgi:hypothetical protein